MMFHTSGITIMTMMTTATTKTEAARELRRVLEEDGSRG